jgi:hypothetical protein
MNRNSSGRRIVVVVVVVVAFVVLAQLALAAGSPAPPRAGAWKFDPIGSDTGLVSGGFTVTKNKTVVDLHGKVKREQDCASGSATVKGTLKMKVVTIGSGIRQWSVGSGRNPSGGLASIPVDLTIGGAKQANATITIAFPVKGQRGAGELNWGSIVGGIQQCVNAYYVVPG